MFSNKADDFVRANTSVTRENVARAKNWLMSKTAGKPRELAQEWLRAEKLDDVRAVNCDQGNCEEALTNLARVFSLKLAFFQAVADLVGEGLFVAADAPERWQPVIDYTYMRNGGDLGLKWLHSAYPQEIERSYLATTPATDVDVFLQGLDCRNLHPGIVEAIEQALGCFRRGLYMPSIAMLAAGTEATWHECAVAVAKNQGAAKLTTTANDPHVGIGTLVAEAMKVLGHGNAKPLLQAAGVSINQVRDAELWTTTLRDRRNALHWGKAKSFVANHGDAGTLLMAAPMHIKTLEAIRLAC